MESGLNAMDTPQRSIAFDVKFEEAVNPDSFPRRLTPQKQKKTSAEEIAEKLWHAEQRRKALLNTSVGDTWHLKYDRRKSVNNAVSYEVNINEPLPKRENDETILQEIRNRKLEAINDKQRRAQQRRKAFIKERSQKKQRAHIKQTSCTDDFVCFEVSFDDKKVPDSKVPSCLASPRRRQKLTVEDLKEKQRKAEERRKCLEEVKVAKARQLEQEALQLNHAVSSLLGNKGQVCNLTKKEVSQHMKMVVLGLGKIKASMELDLKLARSFEELKEDLAMDCKPTDFKTSQLIRRAEKRHRMPSEGNSVVFNVPLAEDPENAALAPMPDHLRKHLSTRKKLTVEELAEKQQKAADRRQAIVNEKLQRVKQAEEDCRALNDAATELLSQCTGAATGGQSPSGNQDVSEHLRTVKESYKKIQQNLNKSFKDAKNLEK